ncbi:hypothetical protein ACTMU2_14320 [Cupriavidus basilensis]
MEPLRRLPPGVALAFDAGPEDIHEVSYRKTRKPHALDLTRPAAAQFEPLLLETLTTKSSSWSYEQEMRKLIFEKDWISKQLPIDDSSTTVKVPFTIFGKRYETCRSDIGPGLCDDC